MIRYLIASILFFFLFGFMLGQNSNQLKKKEKEIQKKIENTKNLIKVTRNSEQLTLTELGIIQHQIAYREELMSHYSYQIRKLDAQVEQYKKDTALIGLKIKKLKEEYKKMLLHAFKNRNADYNYLYIISAKTFSEAFHRMDYIQHYADYRQNQIEQIKIKEKQKVVKIDSLQHKIEAKIQLTEKKDKEKSDFEKDRELQKQNYSKLKSEEIKYKNILSKQTKKKKKIALAIRKAIEEEVAAKMKATDNSYPLTPKGTALSKSFISNKGKLPWPVDKGIVTGKYGKHKHDVVSTAMVENNGVDISTNNNGKIKAVFNGKVTSVLIIPGAGKVIMISHGEFRTVYANLKEVYVKKGDQVKKGQELGVLLSLENGKLSEAHFEIWKITSKGMHTENPASWLISR
jgi:septal ring factor EnvC (AmiA/AmiB activator)